MAESAKKRRKVLASVTSNDALPICPYGSSCYRRNPRHFQEFSHALPGLSQSQQSASVECGAKFEGGSNTYRTAGCTTADRPSSLPVRSGWSGKVPACRYGADCYRKNLLHFAEYWHPVSNGKTQTESQTMAVKKRNPSRADSSMPDDSDGHDTESCEDSTDDEIAENRNKLKKFASRGPSIVKKYSELTEEERKDLILSAMEAKKKMEKELMETKKRVEEKEEELKKMQEKIGKEGMPLVPGETEALAGNKVVYFPLFAEREYKEGSANQVHFRLAESQFYRLLATGANVRIEKVDYVVSPGLVKRFRKARENLERKRGVDKSYPVLAFHGTADDNIDSIVREGFKVPGEDGFQHATDTGFYGSGVYFSEYPNYAMGYIKGGKRLLLCLVLLGKAYKCEKLIRGASRMKGYDSHTSPDVKELIIFNSHHILPCYIVYYSSQYGDFKYRMRSSEGEKKNGEELKKLFKEASVVKPCDVFKNMNIVLYDMEGAAKHDVSKLIAKHGGKNNSNKELDSPHDTLVICSKPTYDSHPAGIAEAKHCQVPVLSEIYLYDCIVAGTRLDMGEYGLFLPTWYKPK
ncbi:uncharacterized protein [Ptychodera flava]|uniref:uncharacterized protein n=1 Tax=Ptychodera flava TaxID=63121 RepID=UPI00396A8AEE